MEIPKRGQLFQSKYFFEIFICILRTSVKKNTVYAMPIDTSFCEGGKQISYNFATFDHYYKRADLSKLHP